MENIKTYIEKNTALLYDTHRELCLIPAPSHKEHKRAEYCKAWFEKIGAKGVYIDDALNVVYPINCDGSDRITVIVAHTDTVFPDTEPMPFTDDGEFLRSPGVGDDTACLSVLMLTAKYFTENNVKPENGMLIVCNSCEEGLGNLKGTRQIFKDYEGRIARFISYDGKFGGMADRCVGSHRYEVEVTTPGGHSYSAFGNKNAIAELAKIINAIYSIEVPHNGNSRTTYNVGIIGGGTSVNTIAQSAKMLCEYRSDDLGCLNIMKAHFERIFEAARKDDVKVNVTLLGERPCMGDVDLSAIEQLAELCGGIMCSVTGIKPTRHSSSTDCNIPLSLGVPALCIGTYEGGGTHTREEWIKKASLIPGLEIGIKVALALC